MTDTTTAAIEALLKDVTPGRAVQFHPSYCPEAEGAPFSEWDTSHHISVIRPDGSRYRIAEFRHSAEAAFHCAARDLVPTLAAELATALRERDNALALNTALAEANEGLGSAAYLATSRAEKAETEAAAWRIAIMKLTPGGSEYTNPDAVIAFVERERADRHKARAEKAKAVREAAALRGDVARLREALGLLSDHFQHGHLWSGETRGDTITKVERFTRAALTSKGGEG